MDPVVVHRRLVTLLTAGHETRSCVTENCAKSCFFFYAASPQTCVCAFPHQPESPTLRFPEKCPIVQKTPEVERKAAAKVSARPPPSYKEVEQHVRSGAATFVFCSAACGAPSAQSRSLFYPTHTHTHQ